MKREPDVPLPRVDGPAEGHKTAVYMDISSCTVEPPRCQAVTACCEPKDCASSTGHCRSRGGDHA
jgi:hypothetical protein